MRGYLQRIKIRNGQHKACNAHLSAARSRSTQPLALAMMRDRKTIKTTRNLAKAADAADATARFNASIRRHSKQTQPAARLQAARSTEEMTR